MEATVKIQKFQRMMQDSDICNIIPKIKKLLQLGSQGEVAIKTLIKLSQALSQPNGFISSQDNYEAILTLVQVCCDYLETGKEAYDKKTLLSCLHFIFKYYADQNEIQKALELKKYILHTADDETIIDDSVQNIYYSIYFTVHGVLMKRIKCSQEPPTRVQCKELLDTFSQALQILACCGSKYLKLILANSNQIDTLLNKVQCVEFQDDKLRFQYKVLDLIRDIWVSGVTISDCDIVYVHYLVLVTKMLSCCINRRRFEETEEILGKMVSFAQTPGSVLEKFTSIFRNILEVFLNPSLIYSETDLKKCNMMLGSVMKSKNRTPFSVIMCQHLANLLINLHMYWFDMKMDWSVEVHLQIYTLLFTLAQEVQESEHVNCTSLSGYKCPLQKELWKSTRLYVIILKLLNKVNENEIDKVVSQVIVTQEQAIKCTKAMKVKGCPLWKEAWISVAISGFNVGCELQMRGEFRHSLSFFTHFCQAFYEMEGGQEPYISIKDGLLKGLQGLIRGHLDLKCYKEALLICTAALVVLPKNFKDIMILWMHAKKNALASEFHKHIEVCTLFHIFTKDRFKLKALFPSVELDDVDICQMLVWELEAYSSSRIDMWKAIHAAGTTLFSLSPSNLLGRGMEILLIEMWKQPDVSLSTEAIYMCDKIVTALQDEMKDSSGEKKQEILATLGNIHYCNFIHQMKLVRDKQKIEVESHKVIPCKMERERNRGEEDPAEVNAICDVTPAYIDLTIVKEAELLAFMAESVKGWSRFLKGALNCSPEKRKMLVNKILPNLESVAHTYALYGCEVQKLNAWLLYFNLSEVIENEDGILLGLCHLLEASDENFNTDYLWRAETISQNMECNLDTDSSERLSLLVTYWLSKCEHYLKTGKYDEGLNILLKIKLDTISKNRGFNMMLYARSKLLLSRYLCLPSTSFICDQFSDLNALAAVGIAFGVIQKRCKERMGTILPSENSQLLCLVMDISEWIGELYLRLKLPRDVRCYVKSQLVLAQMLALSTRTVQFLSKLAQVDLLCLNVPDCQVKLQGMESILQQQQQHYNQSCIISSPIMNKQKGEQMTSIQNVLLQLEDLELSDVILSKRCHAQIPKQSNSTHASPVLNMKFFVLPDFMCHSANCKCHLCNNLLLQNLMVETTHIQAQLHVLEGNGKHALSFFKGGLQLGKMLQGFQRRLISNLSSKAFMHGSTTVFNPLLNAFNSGFVKFLSCHAEFLALCCRYEEAEKLNASALNVLNSMKEIELHLLQEFMDQRFCLRVASIVTESTIVVKTTETPVISNKFKDVNTPFNPTSAVARKVLFTEDQELEEKYGSPPKRIIPSIAVKLFTSGDDTDAESCQVKLDNPKVLKASSSKSRNRKTQVVSAKSRRCNSGISQSTEISGDRNPPPSLVHLSQIHSNYSRESIDLNPTLEENLANLSLSDHVFESPSFYFSKKIQNESSSTTESSDELLSKQRMYQKKKNSNRTRWFSTDDESLDENSLNEIHLPASIQKSPATLNNRSIIESGIFNKHVRKLIIQESSESATSSTSTSDEIFSTEKGQSKKSLTGSTRNKQLEVKLHASKTDCIARKDESKLSTMSNSKKGIKVHTNKANKPLSSVSTINMRNTPLHSRRKKNAKTKETLFHTEAEQLHVDNAENVDPNVFSSISKSVCNNSEKYAVKISNRDKNKLLIPCKNSDLPSVDILTRVPPSSSVCKKRSARSTKATIFQETVSESVCMKMESETSEVVMLVTSSQSLNKVSVNKKQTISKLKNEIYEDGSSNSSENSPPLTAECNSAKTKTCSVSKSYTNRRIQKRIVEDEQNMISSSRRRNAQPSNGHQKVPSQVTMPKMSVSSDMENSSVVTSVDYGKTNDEVETKGKLKSSAIKCYSRKVVR